MVDGLEHARSIKVDATRVDSGTQTKAQEDTHELTASCTRSEQETSEPCGWHAKEMEMHLRNKRDVGQEMTTESKSVS